MKIVTVKFSCRLIIAILCLPLLLVSPLWAENKTETIVIKGETRGSFEQAPEEVQFALKALIAALRGEVRPDQFGPVLFDGDLVLRIRNAEGTFYKGFDVKSIQISSITRQADAILQLTGRILWQDQNKRRAATAFALKFKTTAQHILILDAMVTRMPPNMPRMLVFLVPESAVKNKLTIAQKGYLPLLELITKKAIQLEKPSSAPRGTQDYLLFAFSLDRLAKGERIDYIIGDGDAKTDMRPKEQTLLNYSGWPVLVLASRFDLKEKKPPLYRIFYTPSSTHPMLDSKPYQALQFTLSAKK